MKGETEDEVKMSAILLCPILFRAREAQGRCLWFPDNGKDPWRLWTKHQLKTSTAMSQLEC